MNTLKLAALNAEPLQHLNKEDDPDAVGASLRIWRSRVTYHWLPCYSDLVTFDL
jgi:hypothetical protein